MKNLFIIILFSLIAKNMKKLNPIINKMISPRMYYIFINNNEVTTDQGFISGNVNGH